MAYAKDKGLFDELVLTIALIACGYVLAILIMCL